MRFPFEFQKTVVLRSPMYPFGDSIAEDEVSAFFSQPLAREALYIASPDLAQELERIENELSPDLEKKKRLYQSLSKYFIRMRTRCTPFGLFSSVSTVEWDEESTIKLSEELNRFTRFDMHYLCALSNFVEKLPLVKQHLKYTPNTSLYVYNDTYRYVEHYYDDQGRRSHQISEVDYSDFIVSIFEFASDGKEIAELAEFISDDEISLQDATEFVEELIDGQLLTSELEFTVTGENYVWRFVEVLEKINKLTSDTEILRILSIVKSALDKILKIDGSSSNQLTVYEELIAELELLKIPIDKKRLFQVDAGRGTNDGTIDKSYQSHLKQALFILVKLSSKFDFNAMDKFKKDFIKRYEDKELPLLQVLDSENGIGYGSTVITDDSMLTRDVMVPGSNDFLLDYVWDFPEQWKSVRLHKALALGERCVNITDKELEEFNDREEDILKLPASISMMFSLTKDDDVRIETAGNPSALNLLGRFAHCSDRLRENLEEIAEKEQAANPNVVLAEIVHLPEDRIGNIVQRPVLRNYEIPYLAKSGVSKDRQIMLDDLMVSVRWNRIYLRSKRLNKEISPRLGTAHNFINKAQPVYQFLAELQLQDVTPYIPFVWNKIDYMYPFLPGVRYKNIILAPAKWFFKSPELEFLKENDLDAIRAKFQIFRQENQLPELFSLADGDNELFINTKEDDGLILFHGIVKKRDSFILVEFFEPKKVVLGNDGNHHSHQFVASLVKTDPTYHFPIPHDLGIESEFNPQRNYSIGDDWLYYQLYTGIKTSDRILKECITPLIQTLKEKGLINSWFFIRYNDPEDHIRIRFSVKDGQHNAVIQFVKHFIGPFELGGQIWKVAIDTYMREINRYGESTIELSETIFNLDSEDVLAVHKIIDDHEFPDYYRWMYGILSVDLLFDLLNFSQTERSDLVESMKESFALEFKIAKYTKKTLSQKYRDFSSKIEELSNVSNEHPFYELLAMKREEMKPICDQILEIREQEKLTVGFNDFVMSHIHMVFNRLVAANQRKHEMVIYDLLFKHYKKQLALEKKKLKLKPIELNG